MLSLEKTKKIFTKLYEKIDGRSLSLKGREDQSLSSKSFVYGEVVPESFYQVIADLHPQPGEVFYDLGSGTGKAVILAHLLFDFKRVTGIELLDSLHNAAADVVERYEKEFRPELKKYVDNRECKVIHGDILQADFRDADIIFMNSTCFQDDLMQAIEPKLEVIHANAHVISLSKPLKSNYFYQYKHKLYEFSWGQATAFYHRKRLWRVYPD